MSTQVSYPGIYIQEFAPQPPIQGVSTSIGCFIGTATMGPINTPTMITSWEQFQNVFGGFIDEPSNSPNRSYLAPAIYGFFLNQGTNCYVVRVGSGTMAFASLLSQPASGPAEPELIATAIAEGTIGNSIGVSVINSSRLATQMASGGPTLQATGSLAAAATTISVSVPYTTPAFALPVGMPITVTLGSTSETITVTSWTVVTAATPTTPGTATIGLPAAGLVNSYNSVSGPYAAIAPTALQASSTLAAAALTFNVVLPASPTTFVLSQALPAGSVIQVSDGITSEFLTVKSTSVSAPGVGTIMVSSALANAYSGIPPFITSLEFTLVVTGATTETWPLLSMNSQHPGYWQTVVQSQMINLQLASPAPTYPAAPPVSNPNPAAGPYPLSGGVNDDRVADINSLNANPLAYLNPLTPIQNVDLIAVPGNTNANVQQTVVAYCEQQFNRFAVLDGLQDSSPGFPNLLAQYGQVRTTNGFAAIYFPWIQVVNPLTGVTEYWPPSGHVTGCIAQTDLTVGVFKAPANVPIAGALGLSSQLSNADQGPLNLLGINILRVFPEQSQPLIWGARTTSTDSSWQYINVRRLFIYVEQSLEQGLRPFIFQPNNSFLWGSMKRTITEFLTRVQSSGGIINFYVKIDATNNPPSVQALGQLYAEVGIQPAYPAEFIILKIGIWDGGSSVTES